MPANARSHVLEFFFFFFFPNVMFDLGSKRERQCPQATVKTSRLVRIPAGSLVKLGDLKVASGVMNSPVHIGNLKMNVAVVMTAAWRPVTLSFLDYRH